MALQASSLRGKDTTRPQIAQSQEETWPWPQGGRDEGVTGETGHSPPPGFSMLVRVLRPRSSREVPTDDRRTLPFPPEQPRAPGQEHRPRRASPPGSRADRREPGCHSAAQLPRERFTTSPIPRRLLDGAAEAIPGLYFIVTFICKGCQSGPRSRLPCCSSLFVTRAQRHTLTGTRVQGRLETH